MLSPFSEPGLSIQIHFGSSPDYHPVLAPVMVELEREPLPWLYGHPFYLVDGRILKNREGAPWSVNLTVELGHGMITCIIPVYQVLDLLSLFVVTYQECIHGIHDNEIVHSDETDMFTRSVYVILRDERYSAVPTFPSLSWDSIS